MKKLIAIAVAAISMAGCYRYRETINLSDDYDSAWLDHGCVCRTKVVTIENHRYIIVHKGGGQTCNIIHAASCSCTSQGK